LCTQFASREGVKAALAADQQKGTGTGTGTGTGFTGHQDKCILVKLRLG